MLWWTTRGRRNWWNRYHINSGADIQSSLNKLYEFGQIRGLVRGGRATFHDVFSIFYRQPIPAVLRWQGARRTRRWCWFPFSILCPSWRPEKHLNASKHFQENLQHANDSLKVVVRGAVRIDAHSFSSIGWIPSKPTHFFCVKLCHLSHDKIRNKLQWAK